MAMIESLSFDLAMIISNYDCRMTEVILIAVQSDPTFFTIYFPFI